MNALTDALDLIHSLDEYHRERLTKQRYWNERDARSDGQVVGALTYARNFDHHEMVTTAVLGDRYSDFFTEMFGVLEWIVDLPPPSPRNQPYGRDDFYDCHVAGKTVPDTLAVAQEFFTYIRSVE